MKTLRVAAADMLSTTGQVAWEPEHRERALSLIRQFAEGHLDALAVRATFGTSSRDVGGDQRAKGVAVVPLTGVLTPSASIFSMLSCGTSLQAFGQQVRAAAADASVKTIVVLTDSPGGYVGLVPETAALLRQARAQKPVLAVVAGLAASAAYWITANATAIEATPSAQVGAIGVYTVRASFARQLERDGVDVDVISAGRYKAEGLPMTQMTEAERQATQARVDESYAGFVADVAAGRGVSASAVRNGFGEGRAVSAKQSLSLGMIDRVALVEDSIGRVLTTGGSAMKSMSQTDQDRLMLLRFL